MLNRDIKDNTVDIYDIKSHKGLKGSLDTRLLTEDGRKSIKEDVERSKRLGQAIGDVTTKDAFKLQDTFAHISETQKDLDVQKAFALANGGKGIETLRGKNSTIEQKQKAIDLYARIYADTYGIDIKQANIIATSKVAGGTHYGNHGKSYIDLNDNAQRNATDYANTLGHEVAHARVSQHKVRDRKSDNLNEQYANTMGSYSADGMQFSSTTYNGVNLNANAVTNKHIQTAADTTLLAKNNADWRANIKRDRQGNGKMEHRELYKREARVLDQAKQQINQKAGLTATQKQLMNLQLNAAACARIKCAEGVPRDDVNYQQLVQLQAIGNKLKAKGLTIEKMLGGSLPEGMFTYGIVDKSQDFITKHGEAIQRGKGAVNAGLGAAGVVAGTGATIATAPLATTGAGALVPAGTAVLTGLAAAQTVDGVKAMFADYTSKEGQRVLDSFTEKTHQGDRNLVKDAAINTALWVGETVVINKVAKLIPDRVKNKAKEFITGGKQTDEMALLRRIGKKQRRLSGQIANERINARGSGWKQADGEWKYPPNDGFVDVPKSETLHIGTRIDRYGDSNGRFLAPEGTPLGQRALPPDVNLNLKRIYEVVKPLPTQSGKTTAWFDQRGGGIQYKTSKSVQWLIDKGYLKEVK